MNQDILGIHHEPEGTELVLLFVRQGVLIGQKNFDLKDAQGEVHELITSFIQQYYDGAATFPTKFSCQSNSKPNPSWKSGLRKPGENACIYGP